MNSDLVSVIIVTWNCKTFIEECLKSLREHLHVPAEVIVVDNASTDGTPEMIEQRFPEVQLIRSGANLGFSKGNNLGIRRSRGRYLALINPDVKVLDGCFDRALEAIELDVSIGVIGPAMIGRDGIVHRSGMRFPSLWNGFSDALALHQIFSPYPVIGGQLMAEFKWDIARDVDVLNGWFWLIRREALEQVGFLDERFFMYGEDVDLCRRLRDAGWRLVFEPKATAIHYGGACSDHAPIRFQLEMQRATLQYWQKHHGSVYRALYTVVLSFHNLIRLVGYGVLFVKAPRDAPTRFKVKLYAACLRQIPMLTLEISRL
jgi:GT2 family glycosyltransferase